MMYILTQEEKDALVPKEELDALKKQVEILAREYFYSDACKKTANMGYCDKCPIAGLNNGLKPYTSLCRHENYSK